MNRQSPQEIGQDLRNSVNGGEGSGYFEKNNMKRGSALTETQEETFLSQPSDSSIGSPLKTSNFIQPIKEHITAVFSQPIQVQQINIPHCLPKINMQPIGTQPTSYFINSNAKVASCKGNYITIEDTFSLQNDVEIVEEGQQQQIQQNKRMRCHSPQERLKTILYESQEIQDTSIKSFTRRKSCKGGSVFGEDTYLMSQRERLFPLAIINMHVKRIILLQSKKLKDSQKKTQMNFWKDSSKISPVSSKNFTGNKSQFNSAHQQYQSPSSQFANLRSQSISQHPSSPMNQRQSKITHQGQAPNQLMHMSTNTFSSNFKNHQASETRGASSQGSPSVRSKSNSLSENFSNFQVPDFAENNLDIPMKGSKTPLSRISQMCSQEKQTRDSLIAMVKGNESNGKRCSLEQMMHQENSKSNEIHEGFQGQPKEIEPRVLHKDEAKTMKGEKQDNLLESKDRSHQEVSEDTNFLTTANKVQSPNSSFVSRRNHMGQGINSQIIRINKITKAENQSQQDRRCSSIQVGTQVRVVQANPNSPTLEKRKFSLSNLAQSSHKPRPDQSPLSSFYLEQHNKNKSQDHNSHLDHQNNNSTSIFNQQPQIQQEQAQEKQLSKMRKVFVTATNKITEQNKTNADNTFYKSYYNLVGKISLNAEISQIPTLSDEVCSTPQSHRKERKSAPMLKKNKPSFSPRKLFQARAMFINSSNKFKLNSAVQRYVGDKSRDQPETSFHQQKSFENNNPLMMLNKQKQQSNNLQSSPLSVTPLHSVDVDELNCKLSEEPSSELKIQEYNILKNCFYQQTKTSNQSFKLTKHHSRNKSSQLMGDNKNNFQINKSSSFNFHENINRRWHNMSSIMNNNSNLKQDFPINLQNNIATLEPYFKSGQTNIIKRAASPYIQPFQNNTHKRDYSKNLNSKKQLEQLSTLPQHISPVSSGISQKKNISMYPLTNQSQKLDIL